MMKLSRVYGVLGSVLALAACSGSSSGGSAAMGGGGGASQASGGAAGGGAPTGTGFSTSVSGSTALGNLSDADAQTLCTDLTKSAALKTIDDFACRTEGLLAAILASDTTDSGIQKACQSAYDQCNSSSTTIMCTGKPSSACTTTVAEYTACLTDRAAAVGSVSAQIPVCSALKAASLQATADGLSTPTTPASCAVVAQKCPEAAGDSGMM